VNRLELEKRAALSRVLREARDRRGWSQEQAAEHATLALRTAFPAADGNGGSGASGEERAASAAIEITRHHVATLENCPASPISTVARRSRLLGLVLALGLDRGEINRLAGGL
jgi:hypothetical protein